MRERAAAPPGPLDSRQLLSAIGPVDRGFTDDTEGRPALSTRLQAWHLVAGQRFSRRSQFAPSGAFAPATALRPRSLGSLGFRRSPPAATSKIPLVAKDQRPLQEFAGV